MEKFDYKREMILWVILLVPVVYLASVWSELPERVPIHFGINGEANGWAGKPAELMITGINILVYVFTLFIRKIDPKAQKEGALNSNFYNIRTAMVILLSAISVIVIYVALPGHEHMWRRWIPACVLLFVAVAGNFMINLKPNWLLGIRTPWTLSNDIVWRKTHQLGGRVYFYGGLMCVALSFLLKGVWPVVLLGTFTLGSTAFLAGYSFWLFKQQQTKAKE